MPGCSWTERFGSTEGGGLKNPSEMTRTRRPSQSVFWTWTILGEAVPHFATTDEIESARNSIAVNALW